MSGVTPIGNVLYYVYEQYDKKLSDLLCPFIYEGFATQWTRTKEKYADKWNVNIFEKFQMRVSRIPEWNSTDVKQEGDRIRTKLNCTYIDKLLEKVCLLKAQILSTVKDTGDKKIKVIIPPLDHFLHQCYIVTSKEIMLNPQLFEDRDNFITYDDKLNRLKTSFEIIRASISTAVRDLLPLDQLLTDSEGDASIGQGPIHETESRESKTNEPVKPMIGIETSIQVPTNRNDNLDPFEKEMLS